MDKKESTADNYVSHRVVNPMSAARASNIHTEPSPQQAQWLMKALAYHQSGDFDQAEKTYRAILESAPNWTDVLNLFGTLQAQRGNLEEAVTLMRRSLEIHPDQPTILNNEGNALRELNRLGDAIAAYDKAISLNPTYERAYSNRGLALQEAHRYDEALANYDKAISLNPDFSDAHYNRANVLSDLKRHEEALASYDKVIVLQPGHVWAYTNRGVALQDLNRHDDAIASYDKAISLDPSRAAAYTNRGSALHELRRYEEALAYYDRAILLDALDIDAYSNRGSVLQELRRFDEALACYDKALALDAGHEYLVGHWLNVKRHLCDWRDIENATRMLLEGVDGGAKVSDPFHFLATSASPAQQKRCAEIYTQDKYPGTAIPLRTSGKFSHDKLRVAYLSADFHNHATAYLMAGLFESHDKTRFETTAISFGPDTGDEMRARLNAAFGRFIDVRNRSDREVALLLQEMEIDIAVDLKGYTLGCRPGILAHRAAPIQVSYLGYPGTLGADYIDYILADKHVIPAEHRTCFTEKIVYLPDSYQVNDANRRIATHTPTRAESMLPETGFVFCCFNNNYKITPEIFDIWIRLVGRVEGSTLWLLESSAATSRNLRREATHRGIAPERLVFASQAKLDEHLARHRLADLFLDTLPYNAHTTASDALWAGLPVLTCTGDTFSGRVATSLLHAVGLPELVTTSLAEYEALALELARDRARLLSLREKLDQIRISSPLFDTGLFTKHMENVYTRMWTRHQAGLPPDHIFVNA